MLLWLLRLCFVALTVGIAAGAFNLLDGSKNPAYALTVVLGIVSVCGLVFFTDLIEKNKQITTISAMYFGLLLGLVLGWLFFKAVEPFLKLWFVYEGDKVPAIVGLVQFLITVLCCYITISTLLQTKDEFRFIIPYVEFSKQVKGGKPLVLDTSVIIDGRIADLCDTRLIDTKLIVPRFVLQELQAIADSSDKLKRNRGRRGLDVLKRMQSNTRVEIEMNAANVPELRETERGAEKIRVDERLVIFAKSIGGRVVTNDFNLNKIAQLQGVDVINLNEIANALKTVALPGELLTVKVVKSGDQPGQGVGYLEDGTMVIIEQGRPLIGQEVPIMVTNVLQTPAGRMIFGRAEPRPHPAGAGGPSPGGG